jgi:hypothetical protein
MRTLPSLILLLGEEIPITGPFDPPLEVDVEAAEDIDIKPMWITLISEAIRITSILIPPNDAAKLIYEIAAGRSVTHIVFHWF